MAVRRRKATRQLTVAAILVALGVVLLLLGTLVEVLDISAAAISSLLVVLAVIELKGKYPYLVYAATALLALLLIPGNAAVMYLLFAGYYPILKEKLEGHLSRPVAWVLKLAIFAVGCLAVFFVTVKLLLVSYTFATWHLLAIPLLAVVFVLYDVAMTRLITAYFVRWRRHFRFLNKD